MKFKIYRLTHVFTSPMWNGEKLEWVYKRLNYKLKPLSRGRRFDDIVRYTYIWDD